MSQRLRESCANECQILWGVAEPAQRTNRARGGVAIALAIALKKSFTLVSSITRQAVGGAARVCLDECGHDIGSGPAQISTQVIIPYDIVLGPEVQRDPCEADERGLQQHGIPSLD